VCPKLAKHIRDGAEGMGFGHGWAGVKFCFDSGDAELRFFMTRSRVLLYVLIIIPPHVNHLLWL